jgi:hypothetical protein
MTCWQIGLRHRLESREGSAAKKNKSTIDDPISTGFKVIRT